MISLERLPWWDDDGCLGTSPGLFFPDTYNDTTQVNKAKLVCQSCRVRQECLQWALDTREQFGIFGGATPRDRMEMLGLKVRRHRRVA